MQRIISGDDVKGQEIPIEQTAAPFSGDPPSSSAYSDYEGNTSPAIVENDHPTDGAAEPMDIDEKAEKDEAAFTTGSSLSSVSTHGDGTQSLQNVMARSSNAPIVMEHAQSLPEDRPSMFATHTLPRTDSKASNDSSGSNRASSQTSSRDWGWFEDVHISEHHMSPYLKRKDNSDEKGESKKGKKGDELSAVPTGSSLTDIIQSNRSEEESAMAVTAPNYVLEESISSQLLWKNTAGQRPPQPAEERAFFEKMWAQNFQRSEVQYQIPVEVLTATSPIALSPYADGNFDPAQPTDLSTYTVGDGDSSMAEARLMSRMNHPGSYEYSQKMAEPKTVKGSGSDGELAVLVRGDNVFGTTVSKSFARASDKGGPIVGVDTVNISIASYRVVESKKHGKYAQFLVIYREGSIRDTIGVWKRYSDFVELSRKVTQAHEGCAAVIANISPLAVADEPDVEHLPNAITSWRLLKKRQRWYRCLDAGYLSLKVFLLERFLHDILFESSSPNLLRDFVGASDHLSK